MAVGAIVAPSRLVAEQHRYDLLVVGAGTAGIPTALFAADRGLRVGLLDAADVVGGTLHLSSATISAAGARIQAEAGIEDSAEAHFLDSLRINHGTGDHGLMRLWMQNAAETVDWLEDIGWKASPREAVLAGEHELYSIPRSYRSVGQGPGLLNALERELHSRVAAGLIDLLLGKRMRALVADSDGRVRGVQVGEGSAAHQFLASKTVLTTGGYGASEEHWQRHHGRVPIRYVYPFSRGDGIVAIEALGGVVKHSDNLLPTFGGPRDTDPGGAPWGHSNTSPQRRPPWEIYVNALGERFMPEDEPSIDRRERYLLAQPDWAFWAIYDERIRVTAPPLLRADVWSGEKLERAWRENPDFIRADTLESLAAQCEVAPGALARTVARYNAGQAVGSDAFRRAHLPSPIGQPPYHAVRHHGLCIVSWGGVAVNQELAPVRRDGQIIPGLHAAGELLGMGAWGNAFLSGSAVAAALTFGRLLGQRVVV